MIKVILIVAGIIFELVLMVFVYSFGFYCGGKIFRKNLSDSLQNKYKKTRVLNSLIKAVINNDEDAIIDGA